MSGEALQRRLGPAGAIDHHVHTQFTSVNHLDVDSCLGEDLEHADRNTCVTAKTDAADGKLGDLFMLCTRRMFETRFELLDNLQAIIKLLCGIVRLMLVSPW